MRWTRAVVAACLSVGSPAWAQDSGTEAEKPPNHEPVVESVRISPSQLLAGVEPTCAGVGSDPDGTELSWTYTWRVNGQVAGRQSKLSGVALKRGQQVSCTATASDGELSAENREDQLVANAPPAIASARVLPETPRSSEALRCDVQGIKDPDGDKVTPVYGWMVGTNLLEDQTGPELSADVTRAGQRISCTVVPTDGEALGELVHSEPIVVRNTPPVLGEVALTPEAPLTTDALSCAPASSSDPDGDPIQLAYVWTLRGQVLEGAETATLPASVTKKGQVYQCTVTPSDKTEDGAAVASAKRTIGNSAPVLAGAKLSNLTPRTGDSVECEPGAATDADEDAVRFTYAWTVDGKKSAITTKVLPATAHRKGQEIACIVTPIDAAGLAGEPVTTVAARTVNTPPTVSVPRLGPASATIQSELSCTPGSGKDADGDAVTVSTRWMVDGKPIAEAKDNTLAAGVARKGQEVVCLSASSDGEEAGGTEASAAVTIKNTVPSIGTVEVLPSEPTTSDAISCQAQGAADVDGDDVQLGYEWLVSGVPVAGQTSPTLSSEHFRKGQTVVCRVTPSDGEGKGGRVASSSVTVRNTPPSGGKVAIAPVKPVTSDPITCTASDALDVDQDRVSYAYQWFVNEADVGVSGNTLLPGLTKKGDSVRCSATPTDGGAQGAPVRSSALVIANSAPSLSSARVLPASPKANDPLTCEVGRASDVDGDEVVFTYRWFVDGKAASGTEATLAPGAYKKGQSVYCEVTPTDGTDAGSAVQASAVRVLNSSPVLSSATLLPNEPSTVDGLSCKPGDARDIDGDTVTYSYRWIAGGVVVGGDEATLDGRFTRREQSVVCEVTPLDSEGRGAPVRSNAALIRNTPPTLEGAHIEPLEPHTASSLSCITGGTRDVDNDLVRLTYSWEVDGQTVSGTSSSLASNMFQRGQSVRCTATPRDATLSGAPVSSDPVVIRNTPPTLASAAIATRTPTKAKPIVCEAGRAADRDGDEVSFQYSWTVDGEAVQATSQELSPSNFSRGSRVACVVTPTDGTDAGAPVSSSAVAVQNSVPEVSSVTLAPQTVATNDTLTASVSAFDLDGDPLSYAWSWFVNDRLIAGANTETLDGTKFFSRDDRVRASVRVSDGSFTTPGVSSEAITIKNTPPTAVSTFLTDPEGGFANMQCVVVGQSDDLDGDKVSYRFQFSRNGQPYKGEPIQTVHPRDTVVAADLHAGEDWNCKVTPTDGSQDGPSSQWGLQIVSAYAAGGSSHSCGVNTLGDIRCWGLDDYGVATAPEGHFRQLAVGGWHNCALRADDNALVCWGHRTYGQSRPPAGEWSQVTSGWWHSCALGLDGKVACWGQGADGRATPPNDAFRSVVAGAQHTCGVTQSGLAKCWGDNKKGQASPPGGRFLSLAAGEEHTCGLREDGSVTCWGSNESGQLSNPGGSFASIAAGAKHTCALEESGALQCWGLDNYGQVSNAPAKLRVLGTGSTHMCGIGMDGAPVCWGRDNYAQLKVPKP